METEALEQMKSFYDQFIGELESHALTAEDLKGGTRGIGSYFRKLRDGRLSDKDVLNATLKNTCGRKELGHQDFAPKERYHPPGRNKSASFIAGCRNIQTPQQQDRKQLPVITATPEQITIACPH